MLSPPQNNCAPGFPAGTSSSSSSSSGKPFVEENWGSWSALLRTAVSVNNSKLPDPFKKIDGSRVTTKADWKCRHQEICRLVEDHVYMAKPPIQNPSAAVQSRGIKLPLTSPTKAKVHPSVATTPSGTGPFPCDHHLRQHGHNPT